MPNDVIVRDNVMLDTYGIAGDYLNGRNAKTFPPLLHEYLYNIVEVVNIPQQIDNNMLNIMLIDSDKNIKLIFNAIQCANSVSKIYGSFKGYQEIYIPSDSSDEKLVAELFTKKLTGCKNLTAKICTIDNTYDSTHFVFSYLYDNLTDIQNNAAWFNDNKIQDSIDNVLDNALEYLIDYINMYINTYDDCFSFCSNVSDTIMSIRDMTIQLGKILNMPYVFKRYANVACIKETPSLRLFNYFHLVRLLVSDKYYSDNIHKKYIGFRPHQQSSLTGVAPKFHTSIDILNGQFDNAWRAIILGYGNDMRIIQIVRNEQ